ncbi:hypothetical protein M2271_000519 [Streptomyces sp. LBL]|uniref:hypothetical protein n=1 Tax=Streptomyces sp. LBL TaxID=2940562 RepID=UPI0024734750|nr:hypothetical protein [Streptomyces sp. LBL]MDH6622732.1 hypothetical protein [Streptomyces sp. LBL]
MSHISPYLAVPFPENALLMRSWCLWAAHSSAGTSAHQLTGDPQEPYLNRSWNVGSNRFPAG